MPTAEPLISIIVPVYNTPEHYMRQCVESVLSQTYSNYELLLIDDGSGPECRKAVDALDSNPQMRIFHCNNAGVSGARNRGLQEAAGKYVMFLDSDDWIENNTLSFAVEHMEKYNYSLMGWNHFYDSDVSERNRAITPSKITYDNSNMRNLLLDMVSPKFDERYNGIFLSSVRGVWGKLYRTDLIKEYEIHFDTDLKIGEDACFNLQYLRVAETAHFENEYFNHYRVDENSANRRYREDIMDTRISLLKAYLKFFREYHYDDRDFQTCYTRDVLSCVVNSFRKYITHRCNKLKFSQKIKLIEKMVNNQYVNLVNDFRFDIYFFSPLERLLLFLIRHKLTGFLYICGLSYSLIKNN